jgi:hypothetical protein
MSRLVSIDAVAEVWDMVSLSLKRERMLKRPSRAFTRQNCMEGICDWIGILVLRRRGRWVTIEVEEGLVEETMVVAEDIVLMVEEEEDIVLMVVEEEEDIALMVTTEQEVQEDILDPLQEDAFPDLLQEDILREDRMTMILEDVHQVHAIENMIRE